MEFTILDQSQCSEDGRSQRAFIVSFGPNRRRDSTYWDLRGDDIGMVIFETNMKN